MKNPFRALDIASPPRAIRRLFWSAVWLVVAFAAIKAVFLGTPRSNDESLAEYVRALAAITCRDVGFAVGFWLIARLLVGAARRPRWARPLLSAIGVAIAAFVCFYAVANVVLFRTLGGFVTYPTLLLIADVRMIRSSVSAFLTWRTTLALVGLPLAYLVAVEATTRTVRPSRHARVWALALVPAIAAWVVVGSRTFADQWQGRSDRRIAQNAPTVFVESWWRARAGGGVRMPDQFPAEDLADFEPLGPKPSLPSMLRRAARALDARARAARRPPNVILVVLESVGARWTGLINPTYRTTPVLESEAAHGVVFSSFYTHIGRSSNSLVSMLLSVYPKLDFRELTEQYPALPGTTLPAMFHERGYRTAFVTPSDLNWAGWGPFLAGHGFDAVWDYHDLACPDLVSSWGVEDRCMVDRMVRFVNDERSTPFFLMAWTTQTHHPYEPSPGVPELDLLRERTPDDWSLGRYLNILHETDHQLARLFEAVRRAGLEDDTLIVVTGDHGQAFGYPHDAYTQGRTIYEEDVHVPLLLWFPRGYKKPVQSSNIGSLVDLAPTITEMAGFPPASDWQGRSLFDARHARRAYLYVAESEYTLGLREENWKYIYNLRDGTEELYDLAADPNEQHNLAAQQLQRSGRYRQRLAALAEANRRQYQKIGSTVHTSY